MNKMPWQWYKQTYGVQLGQTYYLIKYMYMKPRKWIIIIVFKHFFSERNSFGGYPGYRGEQSHDKTREQVSGEVFWFHLRRQQLQRRRGARREGKLIF